MKPTIGILMGSDSDLPVMTEAQTILDEFGVVYETKTLSAHRTPEAVRLYATDAIKRGIKIIIAGAGGAAHLAGVVASLTTLPVIGVPIKTNALEGADSLYSTVQMPPGVPVATVAINGAKNAGLLAIQILSLSDASLAEKFSTYKQYLGFGKKYQGKVRDFYIKDGKRILITTDRQSAFDVILGFIPHKGVILNLLSAFWFDKTRDIIVNHKIVVPEPNVLVARDTKPIPVEMIVRGFLTGVTKTSIWYSYERGERLIYGIRFPDGLKKNQKLPRPIITPTTHPAPGSALHDERLTRQEIIDRKIVSKKLYEQMEKVALLLFARGTAICARRGLILVDTKYEFGLYKGKLMLIDEIHTPDSSRFWIKKTYESRFRRGLEPENFDKEFLRLWYVKRGYRGEGNPPAMPKSLISAVSRRYISVYETITGKKFRV